MLNGKKSFFSSDETTQHTHWIRLRLRLRLHDDGMVRNAIALVPLLCVLACVRAYELARARSLHAALRTLGCAAFFENWVFFFDWDSDSDSQKKKKTIGCAASTNWPCDGRLYTKRPVHEAQHPLTIAKEEVRRKKCNPGQCRQHNVVSGRVVAQTVFLLVEAQPLWPKTRGGHCKTREDKPDQTTETSQFPSSPKKDKKNKKTFFFN